MTIAALLFLLQDDALAKVEAAAGRAREKLADVQGVRAVSYAGVDREWRLIVSVETEEAREGVRKTLGWEFEGILVRVYAPSSRAAVWAKPKEDARPPPKPKDKEKKKDDPIPPPAEPGVDLSGLEGKTYRSGVETISMTELLECDGIREHFGLPACKRKKRCSLVIQVGIGGREAKVSQRLVKHRADCPFGNEKILYFLPPEARKDLQDYAKFCKKEKP